MDTERRGQREMRERGGRGLANDCHLASVSGRRRLYPTE